MASVGEALAEERSRGTQLEAALAAAQAAGAAAQAGLDAETAQRTDLEGKVCSRGLRPSCPTISLAFHERRVLGTVCAIFLCLARSQLEIRL